MRNAMKCMIFNRLYSKVILNSTPSLFKKKREKKKKEKEKKKKKKIYRKKKKGENKRKEVSIPIRFGVQPN